MTINPPILNSNDHQFRFQILQACSRNFLTSKLPDGWYDLTELEQDDFLSAHAWRREASTLVQPNPHLSAEQLWQLIEFSADTFSDFLSSKGLTPENLS